MDLGAELSATLEAVYDTVIEPEAWPEALHRMRVLLGGAGSTTFLLDHDRGIIPFFASENLHPNSDTEYENRLHGINPRAALTMAEPSGTVCWDYRVVAESEIDRNEFYDGIRRLSGVRYFVGMRPVLADGASLLVSVERTAEQGHFERHEIALFSQVAMHVGHAFRLAGSGARHATDAALLHLVGETRPEALFLLDERASLIDANAEAARVLALNDGLRLADGCLAVWKAADARTFNGLLAGALLPLPAGGVMALPRPSGALPFLLRVVPWPRGRTDPARRPSVVVLLRDPERQLAATQEEISGLLGLSEREAALALRVARGANLQAAAVELCMSYNTARAHLRSIFDKTGTASQRDLQRLILSTP